MFMSTVPAALLIDREPPTQKGVEDRFQMIISKRLAEVKMTAAASGILEVYGEKEILQEDIILEIDEHSEQEHEENGRRLEKKKS